MQPEFVKRIFGRPREELGEAEQRILLEAHEHRVVSTNAAEEFQADTTYGQRLADSIARIGGSWGFIIAFFLFLLFWAASNTILLRSDAFDPYPFIFLNLMLSTLAAVQAPIIMMSQNRQSAKDRLTASVDYEINLRAELEIMRLHEKLDQMRIGELAVKVDELCARMDGKGVS